MTYVSKEKLVSYFSVQRWVLTLLLIKEFEGRQPVRDDHGIFCAKHFNTKEG